MMTERISTQIPPYPVIISKLMLSSSQSSYDGDSSLELLSLTLSSSLISFITVVGASSFSASIFSIADDVVVLSSIVESADFVTGKSIRDLRRASHDIASRHKRIAVLLSFSSMLALFCGQVEEKSSEKGRKKFSLVFFFFLQIKYNNRNHYC